MAHSYPWPCPRTLCTAVCAMPWQQQLDANRAEKGALGEPEVSKDPSAEAPTGNGGEESQGENGEGHPSAQPSWEARRAREPNPQRLLAGCCCALRLAAVGSCEEQPTVAQSCWFCCRFRCWRCLAAAESCHRMVPSASDWRHPRARPSHRRNPRATVSARSWRPASCFRCTQRTATRWKRCSTWRRAVAPTTRSLVRVA